MVTQEVYNKGYVDRMIQLLVELYIGSNHSLSKGPNTLTKSYFPPTIMERVAHGERYKTELCRHFKANRQCKYAEKCQYAHGANELRIMRRHPKYKTDKCKTFHKDGFCPYGSRCHFLHDDSVHYPPSTWKKLPASSSQAQTSR